MNTSEEASGTMKKNVKGMLCGALAAMMLLAGCAPQTQEESAVDAQEDSAASHSSYLDRQLSTGETQAVLPLSPEEEPEPEPDALVPIEQYIPGIYVELKYATDDNITGQAVYDFTVPFLRYSTVQKLAQVQETLLAQGYSLKIWDAFRPTAAQFDLWEAMPDGRYIANPYRGYSDHSRGNCVDITLVTADGEEIPMPTGFDDFTSLADRDYSDLSGQALENVQLLEDAMVAAGFVPYSAEWWHFTDETDYDVVENFDPAAALTEITVSAIGDNILATGYGFGYVGTFEDYMDRVGGDFSYFFSGVYDILSSDDLTIGNAENVFTTAETRANKDHQGSNAFWFKSDPSYAEIYAEGSVEAVTTANNHSHDYGELGYEQSLQALEDAGVTTFGYGQVGRYQVGSTTFALLGFNVLGPLEYGVEMEEMKAEVTREIADAREWADVIVTYFHWGAERDTTANEDQRELATFAADCGADIVLGSHPHVLQEVERYGDTVIAYSLGNFVYGGSRSPAQDTMILSLRLFTGSSTGELAFLRYEVIPAYVYSGSSNDYQPVLAG